MLYEPILRDNLIKVTKLFARHTDLAVATVARRILGDSKLFDRISEGGTFSVRFYDRAVSRFAQMWPEDAEWPESVPRPSPQQIVVARKRSLNSRSQNWN